MMNDIDNERHTRRLIFSESSRLSQSNGRSSNGFGGDKIGFSSS